MDNITYLIKHGTKEKYLDFFTSNPDVSIFGTSGRVYSANVIDTAGKVSAESHRLYSKLVGKNYHVVDIFDRKKDCMRAINPIEKYYEDFILMKKFTWKTKTGSGTICILRHKEANITEEDIKNGYDTDSEDSEQEDYEIC
jgi:hypothetical protein